MMIASLVPLYLQACLYLSLTTTAARGLLPPGLGVTLSHRHFVLLLIVVDVVVVVSAPPVNAAALVSL
jgi:hypothetical protein